jgi:hypothetical protein
MKKPTLVKTVKDFLKIGMLVLPAVANLWAQDTGPEARAPDPPILIAQNPPTAPSTPSPSSSSSPDSTDSQPPTLDDLGFSPDQAKGSAKDQARLNKRAHMLLMHQRLGLITIAPLAAALISSGMAGGGRTSTSTTGRYVHAGLGIAATDLYWTTAMYAIFAPKIPGTQTHGGIRMHKILAWVHGSGMIATPILGSLAYKQRSRGERVHGIAAMHPVAAWTTGIAYGLAVASVSFKF